MGQRLDLSGLAQATAGALRLQWQPEALSSSGHYQLLSAPLASGREHLTRPVVTEGSRAAGSKVKYSLLWKWWFSSTKDPESLAWFLCL